MPVDRKHMKIGVAALAATALVIGLSVGLTQKNRTSNRSSELAATGGYRMSDCVYVEVEVEQSMGKSGKGSKGSKSGKFIGSQVSGVSVRSLVNPLFGCFHTLISCMHNSLLSFS